MTGVGIYFVFLYGFGIAGNLIYAARGGIDYTPGVLVVSAIWASVNLVLMLMFGTGSL